MYTVNTTKVGNINEITKTHIQQEQNMIKNKRTIKKKKLNFDFDCFMFAIY